MTPAQLRAARALVDWTQPTLAERSGVSLNTIKMFEKGASDPRQSTILSMKLALARSGVEFLDGGKDHGPGVRFRDPR